MLWFHKTDKTFNVQFSEVYLRRISFQTQNIKTFFMFVFYNPTFPLLCFTVWFIFRRLQQRSIERAMDLTDSFTWEDLPTREAESRQLTAAGWIPRTIKYGKSAAFATFWVHFAQSTIRIVTNHETLFIAWYPFDWTVSPFYELVNISQVTVCKT